MMLGYRNLNSLYDCIIIRGEASYRELANLYNTSATSIFRRIKRIKGRSHIKGSEFFESEEGQEWVIKMVVAVILVFGIMCNIGAERLTLFFSLLSITAFIGLSARSIGRIEERIEHGIEEYRKIYDKKIKNEASSIDIIAGADETFFDNLMILVLMDLKSGFIFCEKAEDDRKHKTWDKVAMPWLSCFRNTYCMVSDRAKALIKLAKDSIKKVSIPDLFHLMQDVSKSIGRPIAIKIAFVNKEILANQKGRFSEAKEKTLNETKNILESTQTEYRKYYRQLSTSLHPFKILTSTPHSAESAKKEMQASFCEIKRIKKNLCVLDPKNGIGKAERQVSDATAQIDIWWDIANNSLANSYLDKDQEEWLLGYYLPYIYWQRQINKTDSKKIKMLYKLSAKNSKELVDKHPLTASLLNNNDKKLWDDWANEICDFFQRTSSAIEGRNGWLSQMHFCGRGLSEKRLKSQTTIHNYFLKRDDKTTACERLSGIKPECLFEFILKRFDSLPLSRIKKMGSG
jgi:DNA-binding Lrp family transcriptional regulator